MSDYIYVRVPGGKVHRKYRSAGGFQGIEGCQLDDTTHEVVITQAEFDAMPLSAHCGNCDVGEDDPNVQHTIVTVGNDSETLP